MKASRMQRSWIAVVGILLASLFIPALLLAQPPFRKPPLKSDAPLQRRSLEKPTSIRPDAHIKKAPSREVVDISYFRMNRPQVITGMVADVQQGKLPRRALDEVSSPRMVESLLKTRWVGFVPETLASTYLRQATPQKVDSRRVVAKPIAQYTSDQMAQARWNKILDNAHAVAPGAMKNPYQTMVSYSPQTINLGTFPYYQTQSAVLSVTSPTDSVVTAQWKKPKPIPKIGWLEHLAGTSILTLTPEPVEGGDGFTIVKMMRYSGILNKGSPQVEQTVTGGGPLQVKAGQDFNVVISFKSPYKMGGATPTLVVSCDKWSIEVPVIYNITSIEEYNVALTLDEPLVNLVSPWQPKEPTVKVGGVVGMSGDGSVVPFGATLKNTGDKPVTAKLEGASLPTGISMDAMNVTLAKNESKHLTLTFKAAPGTPTGKAMSGSIKVTFAKDKSLVQSLQFTVRESYIEWTDGWKITDKVTWTTKVAASSTGMWHWTAHLKDSSTWYGDAFVVGFYFNANVDGQYPGREEQGTLGAKYSGPATNYWIDHSGVSQKISSHWSEFHDKGVWFFGNAYGDLTAIVEWMAKTGLSIMLGSL